MRSACSITISDAFGHVDADFDDRGRDQQLDLAALESLHHRGFFRALQPAVHETDLQLRKRRA